MYVWRHFTEKADKSYECNFCKLIYKQKNVNKFENHLANCLHCPDSVKAQMKSNTLKQPRDPQNVESDDESQQSTTSTRETASQSGTPASSRPGTPSTSKSNPLAVFLDRMSDDKNVKLNFFLKFLSQTNNRIFFNSNN